MEIEIPVETDIAGLSLLANSCLKEGFSRKNFRKSLDNSQEIVLSAKTDDKIVGYLVCAFAANEADLVQIGVIESNRKQKIGTALLQDLLKRLRIQGIEKLFLEVRESNVSAITFYESFGFIAAGKRRNFYNLPTEDAICMVLEINDR